MVSGMSEASRWFTSISGSVIFHVFLLLLVFLILQGSLRQAQSRQAGAVAPSPKASEVTVMLGDLMEQLKVDVDARRPSINADANEPEAKAPEQARFESDRNTSAASQLQPDTDLPQLEGPTLAGEVKIPRISLFDQTLRLGELEAAQSVGEEGAAASPLANSLPEVAAPDRAKEETAAEESTKSIKGFEESSESAEDEAETPEDMQLADEIVEAESPKTFQPRLEESLSSQSMKIGSTEAATTAPESMKIGNLQPTKKQEGQGALADGAKEALESETRSRSADTGLLASRFTPEERQSVLNGSLQRVGQNAVDAEATPRGKYEALVRRLINKNWHNYRPSYTDFIVPGEVSFHFTISRGGRVSRVKLLANSTNTVVAEFSMEAVLSSKLPPIPPEIEVAPSGLSMKYSIIIY